MAAYRGEGVMDIVVLLAALFVYLILTAIFSFAGDFDISDHNVIWWPVTLFKFLVRTLWLSLTTGWRP